MIKSPTLLSFLLKTLNLMTVLTKNLTVSKLKLHRLSNLSLIMKPREEERELPTAPLTSAKKIVTAHSVMMETATRSKNVELATIVVIVAIVAVTIAVTVTIASVTLSSRTARERN